MDGKYDPKKSGERSMFKRRSCRKTILFVVGLTLLLVTGRTHAQPTYGSTGLPPIAAPLIREGELAMKLLPALGLGLASDEITAESRLGDAGIMPRNGWIADYPVTPDIMGELHRAVSDAADAGILNLSRDQALNQMDYIAAGLNVSASPYTGDDPYAAASSDAGYYPDAAAVNNYYYAEGPPVYTYFAPPDDYYSLYSYVPYPFWSSGVRFPGFFILRDFHRTVRVHGHPYYCSNHFRHPGSQLIGRVDPIARLGQAGASSTGVPYAGSNPATSIPRSGRAGATVPHARGLHSAVSSTNYVNNPAGANPYRHLTASYRGAGVVSPSYGGGMTASLHPDARMAPSSYRGGAVGPTHHGGSTFSGHTGGFSGRPAYTAGGGRVGGSPARGGGHR
jgi:hypothetical protein